MAEGARLESVYTDYRIGGSNPPLTAINEQRKLLFLSLNCLIIVTITIGAGTQITVGAGAQITVGAGAQG